MINLARMNLNYVAKVYGGILSSPVIGTALG
jgi:hypothetical protein